MKEKRLLKAAGILLIFFVLMCAVLMADYLNLVPEKYYTAEELGIATARSTVDFNDNGRDDYTDLMLGARKDVQNRPKYDPSYYEDAYPPDNRGVCTDVVWRAFRNAGYSLKDMLDADVAAYPELYPRIAGKPDPNIDFRRVPNLKVFFNRYAVSLTLDADRVEEWQPGDIVTYGTAHIAVVSDRRNKFGVPYIIHNGGQPVYEEDALTREEISGHYRFDASKLDKDMLIAFSASA